MPRKKSKHQFRRGNEQKYNKTVLYARHSSSLHIPVVPLVFILLTGGLITVSALYRTAIIDSFQALLAIQLPHFTFPEISFPHSTLPVVHMPRITIDFSGMWNSILSFVFTVGTIFELIFQAFITAISSIIQFLSTGAIWFFVAIRTIVVSVVTFVLEIDLHPAFAFLQTVLVYSAGVLQTAGKVMVAYLNPLIIWNTSIAWETAGILLWLGTLTVPPLFIMRSFAGTGYQLYTALIVAGIALFNVTLTAGAVLYAFSLFVLHLCTVAIQFVLNAFQSFAVATGKLIDAITHAIGVRVTAIVNTVSPYINYVANTFRRTMRELGQSVAYMGNTLKGLFETYQRNVQN